MDPALMPLLAQMPLRWEFDLMVMWVLMISLSMPNAMAFKNQDECLEAAANLKVPAMCIPFAADIPDGKMR